MRMMAGEDSSSFMTALVLACAVLAWGGVESCRSVEHATLERFEYSQIIMGVQARIVLYASGELEARQAAHAAFVRLSKLEAVMSDYRADSELSRLNRGAGQGPVPVSRELYRVLEMAQVQARNSQGAFDVSVGPLVDLWRAAKGDLRAPAPEEIAAALERSGWQLIRLAPEDHSVELSRAGMRLDLGGIGKGYAADRALELLLAKGISRCLVELGGDVAVADPPPGHAGWRISALVDGERIDLSLARCAAATSGDSEQFVELSGIRYSHIIDPRTGWPLSGVSSRCVVAPDAATADALASAVSVLDPEAGRRLIERHPGALLVVAPSEEAAAR